MNAGFKVASIVILLATVSLGVPVAASVPVLAEPSSVIEHIIAPQVTDPAIDRALDNHYAWVDPAAITNHRLFLYLPGTSGVPANALLVQQEAAQLGYHSIGLMYVDSDGIQGLCAPQADPSSCSYASRLENQTGSVIAGSLINVDAANSIDNRLTKLLAYLVVQYPTEGWAQFLTGGKPQWSEIAVGGISQGGGQAAFIGLLRMTSRVLMFSAPVESYGGQPPSWESQGGATPADRYWGFAHDRDVSGAPDFAPTYQHILVGWTALGLSRFGPMTQVEASAPPYDGSQTLFTDLKPHVGPGYTNAHASTVIDAYTPLEQGMPVFAPTWQYMLTAETDD